MVLVQKQTHRSVGQNRAPRNEVTLMYQLICIKGCKRMRLGKDSIFNKWYQKNYMQKNELEHSLTPYTKINQNGLET